MSSIKFYPIWVFSLMTMALVSRVQADQKGIFVRLENLSNQPVWVELSVVIHTEPFAYTKYISRAGLQDAAPPKEQWLPPGERTSWVDITSLNSPAGFGALPSDARDDGTFIFVPMTKEGDDPQPLVPIAVAVANKPDDQAIIRRIVAPTNGEPLALMIKNDLSGATASSPQARDFMWTVPEDAQATLDFVKGLQLPGKRPEHIKIENYILVEKPPFTKLSFPDVTRTHLEVLSRLGFNTIGWGLEQRDLLAQYGLTNFFVGATVFYHTERKRYAEDIDWAKTEDWIEALAKQWRDAGQVAKLSSITFDDEPACPSLEEMRNFGPCNDAFRDFLRKQKVPLSEILTDQTVTALRAQSNSFLFLPAERLQNINGTTGWTLRDAAYDKTEKGLYFGEKYLWCDWFDGLQQMQQRIEIPSSGLYRIWVRHRNVPKQNAFFQIEMSQTQKPKLVQAQPGIEGGGTAVQQEEKVSRKLGSFGFGDDKGGPMVWESMDVNLNAGEATLTLTKQFGYQPWTERKIDCFLLTTDTTYRPDDVRLHETISRASAKDGVATWQGKPMGQQLDPWQYVRLSDGTDAQTNPQLFYWSCDFRSGELTRTYAHLRQLLRKHFGTDVPTTASLAARFIVDGAVCERGPDLFGLARQGAWTLPESADGFYYQPEAGPQLSSFVGDILRSGADSLAEQDGKWRGIGYLALGFGSAITDWMRLETYSILGRGARTIDYYTYGPKCFAWYDFYQNNLSKLKTVGELAHEIGGMEDLGLADAKPASTDVALVFSKSSDYQEFGRHSNVLFHEFQWLYISLRHLHQQVDMVTEEEVANGILERRKYSAAYIMASNLTPAAAEGFAKWVEQGGVLFYEGGPFQDQFGHPLPSLAKLFGAQPAELQYDPKMIGVTDAVNTQELDRFAPSASGDMSQMGLPTVSGEASALYLRAPLQLSNAQVLARFFSDGKPAITVHTYGAGKAVLSGALLGCAYMRDGKTEEASPQETARLAEMCGSTVKDFRNVSYPQTFSETARDLIDIPLHLAKVQSDAWATEPLVEVNPLRLKDGMLILLSDYTRKQQTVDLFVRSEKPIKKVSLLQGEPVNQVTAGGILQIRIPIKLTQAVRVYTD